MGEFKIRYRVRLRSPRSKYYVVEKCMVGPSNREPCGHYTPLEIISRPLDYDQAYAFCARRNEEEAKEKRELAAKMTPDS